MSRPVRDALKPSRHARTRRIPAARTLRPSLIGVAALVKLVESLCTAGLPAMDTAIILGHIDDDAPMVGLTRSPSVGAPTDRGGFAVSVIAPKGAAAAG